MHPVLRALCLLVCCTQAAATDWSREQLIAQQLEGRLSPGSSLWLTGGTARFLAIHLPAHGRQTRGGVILLHDRGATPDADAAIHSLRVELPHAGWETLSVQMPVAGPDLSPPELPGLITEASPRIAAAVDYFKTQRKQDRLVLLGQGLGARMALAFLSSKPPQEVRGFIAVGLPSTTPGKGAETLQQIAQLRLPMLDIYGTRGLPPVTRDAGKRRLAARQGELKGYRQVAIPGADQNFVALEPTLVSRVSAWLRHLSAGFAPPGPQ